MALPNVSPNAASVGDYINQNYLRTYTSVTFDIIAGNADFFSGTLSTDSLADFTGRTVWGFIQQRANSVDNSKLYKYFAIGIGGAGSVSPFNSGANGILTINYAFSMTMSTNDGGIGSGSGKISVTITDGTITNYTMTGSGSAITVGEAQILMVVVHLILELRVFHGHRSNSTVYLV